ncbi:LysR family transcriptional regulator ArgP [Clavibacter michiganensis subsp. phaseoli]|jgi:LysR family transcriptional regulator (chromosome initiation inhibitor)|uniref:LysR family transcriptional regulator ArgP n=2 Tax=Clavibacter TaxID=1573 RepID=A0A8I0VID3_9MICO|nr:LysR family transcriptional regulator ArgP [Clavibacter phaseoli]MBF4632329.1 LysR family transcriptional regulator ArgP [Clavibacter phaseoli]
MMDIRTEHLRTLAAVIDTGTLDAAARALRLTPSAVSQRITALERSAGRVLLRRTRPATTTEAGDAVLRHARQVLLLERDLDGLLGVGDGEAPRAGTAAVPVVVNGDSLASWLLPAFAALAAETGQAVEVLREDEHHSLDLLRDGSAMAAVTSVKDPVQGCTSERLGRMRYRALATPAYVAAHLPDGPTPSALAVAPLVMFDRKDAMQDRWLRGRRAPAGQPRHYVPSSAEFVTAVTLGMGWGMLPDLQSEELVASGALVPLDAGSHVDVALHWQRWSVDSPVLADLTRHVRAAAASLR